MCLPGTSYRPLKGPFCCTWGHSGLQAQSKAFSHNFRRELANGKEESTALLPKAADVITLGDLFGGQWHLLL